ncbi:MAG: UDP-N-acetylmuramoyl-tripeptide--D-alanyl-D-alanine ligase [Coriobacteriia bacterium]|nr:UDP-N-acetylmuramoyl-tripeptide--D-alanyl-D-alanine ligase [Coriobacteriia bacterium]
MLRLDLPTMLEVTGGELVSGPDSVMVNGLAIDSRDVEPGAVFVAFGGERADGHAFLGEAVARGARALVVTRDDDVVRAASVATGRHQQPALVLVPDALAAVQALAAHHRDRLMCPVIGVTGSTGKTTTKDLIEAALTARFSVVATRGNQNNELGVPLTLLAAGAETEAVVIEMAMRGAGQIARLCETARPTHGLVTNVGVSHVGLLGSAEAVAEAKGELVEAVPLTGVVYLNGDDAASRALAARAAAPVVMYGLGEDNDVRALDVAVSAEGCPSFTLAARGSEAEVVLAVCGRHNVYNALGAAAVALDLGLSVEETAQGLACASPGDMRMQVFTSASGVTVVNDAYNANPTSMRAALQALDDMTTEGRRIAVLGDMAELGSLTELAHFQLGEQIARHAVDVLVTVGEKGRRIADGARAAGVDPDAVRPCVTVEEASEVLDDVVEPGDLVLVKASRSVGLERVVEGIVTPHVR